MHHTTDTIQPGPIDHHQLAAHRYQCHHVFPDAARCGSPALRNETRCYYHHETRKPVSDPHDRNARMNSFEFPFPDSRTAVQSALGDLMVRIGSNDIDPRRAGLLLYCLQLAQANLKASELAIAHEAQQHEAKQHEAPQPEARQTTEGAPGFSPVNHAPIARGFSPGLSNEVQTDLSSLEDFAQKPGEGEATGSNHNEATESDRDEGTKSTHNEARVPHPSRAFCAKGGNDTVPAPSSEATHDSAQGTPISRATFAVLLESLARHHGINVDDPIYTNHNQDSPILAALRAEADQLTTCNLQLTTPLVILNHSNAKQTNCPDHPRRLGLPCRDPRKRHRTGPQAHLRQASGDLPQHPHPRQ